MRLGLDFDNTIVRYDALFHRVALEGGWIPPELPATKLQVRDHLRSQGREQTWIEMQGYVYGARMAEADMYPGVERFLQWARDRALAVCIVSHKTLHPFAGPKYDLHEASRAWVAVRLRDASGPLVELSSVHFELTKEAKFARIQALACTAFLDDLPEILLAPAFPKSASPILFDPDRHHSGGELPRLNHWDELRPLIEKQWTPKR
jgi:hypothetical protein